MGRRGKTNDSNIFVGAFCYFECDALKQMELYTIAAYPYLTLMIIVTFG